MAKKKHKRKVTVKNPKLGVLYEFYFAGNIFEGKIIGESSLSVSSDKIFMIESLGPNCTLTKYPVDHRDIILHTKRK